MMKPHIPALAAILVILCVAGCETPKRIQKAARPVADPILKTTEAVLQERTFSPKQGAPQAVLFPREEKEKDERSHLKIKF